MLEENAVKCPFCGIASKASNLSNGNFFLEGSSGELITYENGHRNEVVKFQGGEVLCRVLKCANIACKKSSLWIFYNDGKGRIGEIRVVPKSSAKPLPEYIPKKLRDDYEEACLILEDSPKASAALARRCLQGMIRDLWDVDEPNLYNEILAIKKDIDIDLYNALEGLRGIGNIGAHPELIVDVNKSDACHLVSLLEFLFDLWYVAEHTKKESLSAVSLAAQRKKQEKKESRTDCKQPDSLKPPSIENIE